MRLSFEDKVAVVVGATSGIGRATAVERFENLNDNAERLFARPDEGLNQ